MNMGVNYLGKDPFRFRSGRSVLRESSRPTSDLGITFEDPVTCRTDALQVSQGAARGVGPAHLGEVVGPEHALTRCQISGP